MLEIMGPCSFLFVLEYSVIPRKCSQPFAKSAWVLGSESWAHKDSGSSPGAGSGPHSGSEASADVNPGGVSVECWSSLIGRSVGLGMTSLIL